MIDTTIFQDKTAVYYTLGCKLNFSETSTIGKTLKEAGIRTARKGEKADICVINTCSVTEVADKKCRQAIHRLVKQHPGAYVVVTGCYAQLKPDQVANIEGVDVVLGAEQKGELMNYLGNLEKHPQGEAITTAAKDIRSFSPSCSRGDRTRYFLKVQDGCDYFCSYCTIPFARGRSRNGRIEEIVEQARQAAAEDEAPARVPDAAPHAPALPKKARSDWAGTESALQIHRPACFRQAAAAAPSVTRCRAQPRKTPRSARDGNIPRCRAAHSHRGTPVQRRSYSLILQSARSAAESRTFPGNPCGSGQSLSLQFLLPKRFSPLSLPDSE